MSQDNFDRRFARIELMIGKPGLRKLNNSFVVVAGLGAVGGYAVEALARAGVGHIRLVDFDEIKPSNINRQLYALDSTIGRPKVDVAAERILDINPKCHIEKLKCFVHKETLDTVLADKPDIIVDAIDSFNPKLELLTAIQIQSLTVISAMGAAMRSDPSMVRLGPLKEVKNCPLARQMRKKLRQRELNLTFPCVYSLEPLGDFEFEEDPQTSEQILERGRKRRVLPSLPTLTGIFGLTAANWTIQYLIKDVK
ncbi:MAG: hypothetical protein A2178_02360 [Planctomycetes bacterium GWC2_49_10]|nr:MAG: hypothetical protein A2178_02360 [Planctomycetes bacterium GWC2_49_10]